MITTEHFAPPPGKWRRVGASWFAESRAALGLVWLVWLLPRAAILLISVTPTSDADWYFSRAASLADGLGYLSKAGTPTAFWPPGWPMALSVVFEFTGRSLISLGLCNLAVGAIAVWLLLDLGRKLFGSELAARAGLLLLALYPNNIGYFPLALTEVFYTSLLIAVCWLIVARRHWVAFIAAGLLLGVATLVKAQTLLVVPVILGIGLLRAPDFWKNLPAAALRAGALIALAALVVAPWTMRNHGELDGWVLVSTNGGITLLTGNNDSATGGYTPEDPVVTQLDSSGLDELAYDAQAQRLGVEWIKTHPAQFLMLMPMKLMRLWATDGEAQWAYETGYANYAAHAGAFRLIRIVNQLYYFALLLGSLAAAALMIAMRRRAGLRWIDWWLLPYGMVAYPTAIGLIFSGQSRFHYPVMPFVCMACGWLVAEALRDRNPDCAPA